MERISGIYCIENKTTNKKYIGKSVDIYERWRQHKIHLNGNCHHNRHLQNAWNKYGSNDFLFYIIEQCDESVLNDKEVFYIQEYRTLDDAYGYNLTCGGDGGNTLINYTEDEFNEYCKKRSRILKGKLPFGEDSSSAKLTNDEVLKIIDCLLNGEHICDISRKFNISNSTIFDIYRHATWRHLTDGINFPKTQKALGRTSKSVDQYDLDGNFIRSFRNARDVENELGICYKQISQVCNGVKRMSHGFVFRFSGDSFDKYEIKKKPHPGMRKIDQYNLDGTYIKTYDSIADAEKEYNTQAIGTALRDNREISCGYIWRYHPIELK